MLKQFFHGALIWSVLAAQPALAQAPAASVETKSEFTNGSGISLQQLTPIQVDNLVIAGKVWGFLKYHHPVVTNGQRQWDFELLRILPALLAAPDRAGADAILHRWIAELGPVSECNPCATLKQQDYYLLPNLDWLSDARLLSPALRQDLNTVYRNRSSAGNQAYVSLATMSSNPLFNSELEYKTLQFPDAGFQLLSLFRFWNIVEYWSPYRDRIGEDWNNALRQSIAPVALAKDRRAYELAMSAVVARLHDSHTKLYSSLNVLPPGGACVLPFNLRFIGGSAVVAAYANEEAGAASGVQRGDIIESIDGQPVARLIESWRPYYAASNESAQLRDMAFGMSRGACAPALLKLRQGAEVKEISVERIKPRTARALPHDRPGDTFQLLADDIAYIKLSSIKGANVPEYMQRAAQTRGLIVDIRNYPSEYVPLIFGPYFVDKPTAFVRLTGGDAANPGGFKWMRDNYLPPAPSHYAGKLMILVDEVSQSQAEYTAMALRAGPRAKVIGSTTAGADGNVSRFSLPGGLQTAISGIGVFYPDKRPTQRIGIVPDIEVRPTIEGIRAGRDEVLDAAIAEIRRP